MMNRGLFGVVAACWLLAGPAAAQTTYTVTTTSNAGAGSLRQAILDANANAGADIIEFGLVGGAPYTIAPATQLPDITEAVTIDGTSQPGYTTAPLIFIDCDPLPINEYVLWIKAANCTVKGLSFGRGDGWGLGAQNAANLTVLACWFGVRPTGGGYTAAGVAQAPLYLWGASTTNAQIGDGSPAGRNVFAGNSGFGLAVYDIGNGLTIAGNYFGVTPDGMSSYAQGQGVFVRQTNQTLVRNNYFGGNQQALRYYNSEQATIRNNQFGMNVAGTGTLPNNVALDLEELRNSAIGDSSGGNIIVASVSHGLHLRTNTGQLCEGNSIYGNRIGLGPSFEEYGNQGHGIYFQGVECRNNTLQANVIGANTLNGILLQSCGAGNQLVSNVIGYANTTAHGNGSHGVLAINTPTLTVSGSGLSGNGGDGLRAQGCDGLVVQSCSFGIHTNLGLPNGGNGISIIGGANAVVDGCNSSANTAHGIAVSGTTSGTIIRNTRIGLDNNGDPLGNQQHGVLLSGSGVTNCAVGQAGQGNVIGGNVQDGVRLLDVGAGNTVIENSLGIFGSSDRGNGGVGLYVKTTNGCLVQTANISGNDSGGVLITGSDGVVVRGVAVGLSFGDLSLALGNAGHGVEVVSSSNVRLGEPGYAFFVGANSGHGVYVRGTSPGLILTNAEIGVHNPAATHHPNGQSGVLLSGPGVTDARIGGSWAEGGTIGANTQSGVVLAGVGANCRVSHFRLGLGWSNEASGNGVDGLAVQSSAGVRLESNLIGHNSRDGIHAEGSDDLVVRGCVSGMEYTGATALPNGRHGLYLSNCQNARIGAAGGGNGIGGNSGAGIFVTAGSSGGRFQGNWLGIGSPGAQPNDGPGMVVEAGSNGAVIGGPGAGEENVMVGCEAGLVISGSNNAQVIRNRLGLEPDGSTPRGNVDDGVRLIGGAQNCQLRGNIIGANGGDGILLAGALTRGNEIKSNQIGTTSDVTVAAPNGANGIQFSSGAGGNLVGGTGAGDGNQILNNLGAGIRVTDPTCLNNTFQQNRLVANQRLGINLAGGTELPNGATINDPGDADNGPHRLLNFPVLDQAFLLPGGTQVMVTGFARPSSTIEFFQATGAGYSQALRFVGSRVEGTSADGDTTTGGFTSPFGGVNVGADNTSRFRFTLPAASLTAGNRILATATLPLSGTSELSPAVTLVGPATQLVFTQQPSDGQVGLVFAPEVTVEARDAGGARVPLTGPMVDLTVAAGPAGAVVQGNQARLRDGVATFREALLTTAGAGYQILASAVLGGPGAPPVTVTSATFELAPGPVDATASDVVCVPSIVMADGQTASQARIQLNDQYGNPVPGIDPGFVRVAALAPGDGVVQIAPPTAPTDTNGRCVAELRSSVPLTCAVKVDVDTLALVDQPTVEFTVTPPSVTGSTVTLNPDTASSDGLAPVVVEVRVRDQVGNPRAGVLPTDVEVSVLPPGDGVITVEPPSVATDADGLTTARLRSTEVIAAAVHVRVLGVDLAAEPTATFTAEPVGAATSQVDLTTPSAEANGLSPIGINLTVLDTSGDPIAGVDPADISIAVTDTAGGDLTIQSPTAPTDAAGRTTASLTSSGAAAGTVIVNVRGVIIAEQPAYEFISSIISAAESTVALAPSTIAADGASLAVLTVHLRTATGDPIMGSHPADRELRGAGAGQVVIADAGADSDADGRFEIGVFTDNAGSHELIVAVDGVELAPVTLTALTAYEFDVPTGLSFVGCPMDVDPDTVDDLLADPGLLFVRWDPGREQYRRVEPSGEPWPAGVGMWLRADADRAIEVRGTPPPAGPFRLNLEPGWNQLANPFDAPFEWRPDAIRVEVGGEFVGLLSDPDLWATTVLPYGWTYPPGGGAAILVYDNSQPGFESLPGSLPAYAGVWLRAFGPNVSLVLPEPGAARGRSRGPAADGSWTADLVARSGETVDGGNLFGLSRAMRIESPPPAGPAPAVELVLVDTAGRALSGDLRDRRAGEVTWSAAVLSRDGGEVTLSWPSFARQVPADWTVELTDLQTGATVLLNTRGSYAYQPTRAGEQRRFELTARPGRPRRATITSLEATSGRDGTTRIRMNLTEPATVNLSVRGLGGTLVDQVARNLSATRSVSLHWNGRDAAGRRVPHGLYRLEAEAISANGAVSRAERLVLIQ